MYYQIIPLIDIASAKNRKRAFTYQSERVFEEGDLVEIPFGKRTIKGVVWGKTSRPIFRTREIRKLIQGEFLNSKQRALAEKITGFYSSYLGLILKFFVFDFEKKEKQNNAVLKKNFRSKKIVLRKKEKDLVGQVLTSKKKEVVLGGLLTASKRKTIVFLLKKAIEKKQGPVLFLVPQISSGKNLLGFLQEVINPKNILFFHSKISKKDKEEIYEAAKKGQNRMIIATKSGLFLPFEKMAQIFVFEEENDAYKEWNRKPLFQNKLITRFLSKIHNAQLVWISPCPTMSLMKKAKEKKLLFLSAEEEVGKPKIELIDLRKFLFEEKSKKIIISEQLKKSISTAINQKQDSLLVIPFFSKKNQIICRSCQSPAICPDCQSPLFNGKEHYNCINCSYKISIFSFRCHKCKRVETINIGFSANNLLGQIRDYFPTANIYQLGKTILPEKPSSPTIFIGTISTSKSHNFSNLGLVSFINSENWPGKNEPDFDLKSMQTFFRLLEKMNDQIRDRKLLIQTFYPEHKKWAFLEEKEWEAFSDSQLEQRKTLLFPPFCLVIKATGKEKKEKNIEKKARVLYNKLKKKAEKKLNIKVYPPFSPYPKKSKGNFRQSIVLKILNKNKEENLAEIIEMIDQKKWTLDIEPENLFS